MTAERTYYIEIRRVDGERVRMTSASLAAFNRDLALCVERVGPGDVIEIRVV